MNDTKLSFWIRVLQFATGGISLIQSAVFLLTLLHESENPSHKNSLALIQSVLAVSEIVAALLFLVPQTCLFGVWALLTVYLLAALLHIAHGDFNVGALIIYAAAVLVVRAYKNLPPPDFNSIEKEESK